MFKKSIAAALALVSFASVSAHQPHVQVHASEKEAQGMASSFEYRKAVVAHGEGMMLTLRTNKGVFAHAIKAGDTETICYNGTLEGVEIESADVTDGRAQANNKAKRFLKSGHAHNTKLLKELQDENHWILEFKAGKRNTISIRAKKD